MFTFPVAIASGGAIVYTASQSSSYSSSVIGSYANLTDFNSSTGAGTNIGGTQWIKATFPSVATFTKVTVAGGNMPTWGEVSPYLNGATLQYSIDDNTWTSILTILGVSDSGENLRKTFSFSAITARYWRLTLTNYLSTTELVFQ